MEPKERRPDHASIPASRYPHAPGGLHGEMGRDRLRPVFLPACLLGAGARNRRRRAVHHQPHPARGRAGHAPGGRPHRPHQRDHGQVPQRGRVPDLCPFLCVCGAHAGERRHPQGSCWHGGSGCLRLFYRLHLCHPRHGEDRGGAHSAPDAGAQGRAHRAAPYPDALRRPR